LGSEVTVNLCWHCLPMEVREIFTPLLPTWGEV
jgi:hypothetical protein